MAAPSYGFGTVRFFLQFKRNYLKRQYRRKERGYGMDYSDLYGKYGDIIELVLRAREIIFDENSVGSVTVKGVADFVTKVDLGVEVFLKEELLARYPRTAFVSEEQKSNRYDAGEACFILDPIDGTTNLIHHYQHSAVALALCERDEAVFGIVYNPFTEEIFTGAKGMGAYLNGRPVHVSDRAEIAGSLITFGTAPYDKELSSLNFPMFERVFKQCADIRISGSAALDICYIAAGRLEAYAERNLKPWDFAAASVILREAGGVIENWNHGKISFTSNSEILASNGLLQDKLLGFLLSRPDAE